MCDNLTISKNNTSGWTINLGVTRRTSTPLFVRQRQVAKLIKHPGFQMSVDYYYSDDIALVLLKEKVEFDEFLRPVCLPANSSVEVAPGMLTIIIIIILMMMMIVILKKIFFFFPNNYYYISHHCFQIFFLLCFSIVLVH